MGLPALPVTLPPATPYTGGLYEAATLLTDGTARHIGGVDVTDPNHGGHGTWLVPDPEDGNGRKAGARRERQLFPSVVAWAADTSKAVGWAEDDALARAEHVLSLTEQPDVERFTVQQLQAGDELDTSGRTSWSDVVGALDAELAAHGHTGVLHASRAYLPHAERAGVVKRQGGRLLTPGGSVWAFGAGYAMLGTTVVATGGVVVRRSTVTTGVTFNPTNNERMAVAERVVTPYWGGPHLLATVVE